jgi:TP901 family phage tail tape measure protein
MGPAAILSILVRAQGIQAATGQLTALNAAGKKAGDAADSMAGKHQKGAEAINKAAKVGVIAVGALAAGAVKMAGDYEQSMNTLQAVSGATGAQMDKLGKLAIKLGADVKLPGTSAQDAATAMQEMIKAGVSMGDTMKGVRGVLVLSAAAQVSNARAAEIASNALNTFKLRGKDVNMVVDQLANTANASSVEISDVADAMQMAGAVFSGFQGPVLGAKGALTELNVAVGLLGNAGIKGSDAGTSLKQTLLQLTGPSNASKAAMEGLYAAAQGNTHAQGQLNAIIHGGAKGRNEAIQQLEKMNPALKKGGDIAYDASGKMRSLKDIIRLTALGTKDMTQEQKNAYLTQIFGADATRTVIALMQAGPAAWDKMTASVTKQGAAQALAAAKMKGFKGSVEAFKSTIETLAITFGTVLLPALTATMGFLASSFSGLGNHKTAVIVFTAAIGGLSLAIWTVNTAVRAYGAAMAAASVVQSGFAVVTGLVTGALTVLRLSTAGTAIGLAALAVAEKASAIAAGVMTAAQWALNVALTANPIGVVVIALAALGAALVLAYQKISFFRDGVAATWSWIKDHWPLLFAIITGPIGLAVLFLISRWAAARAATAMTWNAIKSLLVGVWAALKVAATAVFAAIGRAITDPIRTARDALDGIWKAIKTAASTAWDGLKKGAEAFAGGLKDAIVGAFKDAVNLVIGFVNQIIGVVNKIPGVEIGKIKPLAEGGINQTNLGQTGHLAHGGAFGAYGGMVNKPIVMMGEEAPRHPEYVIPTNPAYRKRAQGLLGQAAGAIGLASGGVWGKGELADLWRRVNPGIGDPNLMAAIALAESNGRQGIVNSIGATGLWQIHPGGAQYLDPVANARAAGQKLATQGLKAWEAYTNGSYRQYLGGGAGGGGGVLGAIGGAISDVAGSISGMVGKLPGTDKLGWLGGLGKYAIGKVKDWITSKIGSIFSSGGGGGGGAGGGKSVNGLVPRVVKAVAFARAHGWRGTITSGYRSVAEQQYLWDNASSLGLVRGKTVAAPGSSSHQRGEAVDVSDIPGFARAMAMMPASERLYSLVLNDPVHFSVSGRRKGGIFGGPYVGAYQAGGVIPQTGMALVHKGETVIPALAKGGSVSIGGKRLTQAQWKSGELLRALQPKAGTVAIGGKRVTQAQWKSGALLNALAPGHDYGSSAPVSAADGDPNQALIDSNAALQASIDAQAAIEQAHTEALNAVKASIDAQTSFAKSATATSNFQLNKYLAEVLSGQIGRGIVSRGFTPGSGVEHVYMYSAI